MGLPQVWAEFVPQPAQLGHSRADEWGQGISDPT
jgi:hypothetical protein